MNKQIEALKLAEEALEQYKHEEGATGCCEEALAAIREALADHIPDATKMVAEPVKQEPAAWIVGTKVFVSLHEAVAYQSMFTHHDIIPLYRNV